MRTPKVTLPAEDPAAKTAREREQKRAETARTEETQSLLLGNTVRRLRRFGAVSGGGSVPIYGPSRSDSARARLAASGGVGGRLAGGLFGGRLGELDQIQSATVY